MKKNILIGALVVVLVGALAVAAFDLLGGSVSADGGQQHGRSAQEEGQGRGSEHTDNTEQQGNGYGRQDRDDVLETEAQPAGNGQGNGRGGAGRQDTAQEDSLSSSNGQRGNIEIPDPQANVEDWEVFEGTVVTFDDEGLTIDLGSDQLMSIEMGPSWYWQEQSDFSASAGDALSVAGFFEDDQFVAATISNQANGQVLVLRMEDGRPMWAGRGRGGQR